MNENMSKIFMSYRRNDSATIAARIYDRLVAQFGRNAIFKDVDAIAPGSNFLAGINEAIAQSAVALIIIGPHWLDASDDRGRRRLDNPDDIVRLEIAAALSRGIPIVPVFVGDASSPSLNDLPPSLRPLVNYSGLPVRYGPDFNRDMKAMLAAIEQLLVADRGAQREGPAREARYGSHAGGLTAIVAWLLELLVAIKRLLLRPLGSARIVSRRTLSSDPATSIRRGETDMTDAVKSPAWSDYAPSQPRSSEPISFTSYYPKEVAPREWVPLLVFATADEPSAQEQAHAEAQREVRTWQQAHPEDEIRETPPIPGGRAIARGELLRVVPEMEGFRFNPPFMTLAWEERWHKLPFRMIADTARPGHAVNGGVMIFIGPLLLAEVPMSVYVDLPGARSRESTTMASATAAGFHKIFASYSHADTDVVLAYKAVVETTGDQYLMDVLTLRSGERWDERLPQLIDEADIFQLFWSERASRSTNVQQEWKHALTLNRERFIRPLYWTNTLYQPVPDELYHLHFSRFDLQPFGQPIRGTTDEERAESEKQARLEAFELARAHRERDARERAPIVPMPMQAPRVRRAARPNPLIGLVASLMLIVAAAGVIFSTGRIGPGQHQPTPTVDTSTTQTALTIQVTAYARQATATAFVSHIYSAPLPGPCDPSGWVLREGSAPFSGTMSCTAEGMQVVGSALAQFTGYAGNTTYPSSYSVSVDVLVGPGGCPVVGGDFGPQQYPYWESMCATKKWATFEDHDTVRRTGPVPESPSYRLSLLVESGTLTFSIDGEQVDTIPLTAARMQTTGVFIGQFAKTGTCSFKNFVFTPLL